MKLNNCIGRKILIALYLLTDLLNIFVNCTNIDDTIPPWDDIDKPDRLFHQVSYVNDMYQGRIPLFAKRRKVLKGEFPAIVLIQLPPAPDLTGALVTSKWALSAINPGLYKRIRPEALKVNMGMVYAGLADYTQMLDKESEEQQYDCPSSKKVNETYQCRKIVEIWPQDAMDDPGKTLILVKCENSFKLDENTVNTSPLTYSEVPPYHREQCTALWFYQQKKTFTGEQLPIWNVNQTGVETVFGSKRTFDLWMKPLGLWHIRHCHRFTDKMFFTCGDDSKDEKIYYGKERNLQGDWREGEEFDKRTGVGGPTDCPSRGPMSVVVMCQNLVAAIKLPVASAFDILINDGKFANKEYRCNTEAGALRRTYIWLQSFGDWIYNITTRKECKYGTPRYRTMVVKKKTDYGFKLTPDEVAKISRGSHASIHPFYVTLVAVVGSRVFT